MQTHNNMRPIIFFLVFLLVSIVSNAQKGVVEGKVTDSKNGQPLPGVSVIVKTSKKGTATNVDGYYNLVVEGNKVSLIFSYNGVTQQVDDIVIEDGKVVLQNLSLVQREKTEEAIVIRNSSIAYHFSEKYQHCSTGYFCGVNQEVAG
jgi:hypothetical protein